MMNGTVYNGMNGTTAGLQRIEAQLRTHGKIVLFALAALLFAGLCYRAASWAMFNVRARALLIALDQIDRSAPSGSAAAQNRPAAPPRPAPTAPPSSPSSEQWREQLAQLEKRALFGDPLPPAPQPKVEAIFGNSALINGQWLGVEEKAGEYTILEVGVDHVLMADAEGNCREFGVTGGESGGSSGSPQTLEGGMAQYFQSHQSVVMAAIREYAPGVTLKKMRWDSARGWYDVETKTNDGRDVDMKIGADGSLRVKDEEITLDTLPPKIHSLVQAQLADGGKLEDLKRWVRDGETYYEAEIKTTSRKFTLEFNPDGSLRNRR